MDITQNCRNVVFIRELYSGFLIKVVNKKQDFFSDKRIKIVWTLAWMISLRNKRNIKGVKKKKEKKATKLIHEINVHCLSLNVSII